jgi:hypothetical protein
MDLYHTWPIQLSVRFFLHWAAATLEGLVGFEKKFNGTIFHHHFYVKNAY